MTDILDELSPCAASAIVLLAEEVERLDAAGIAYEIARVPGDVPLEVIYVPSARCIFLDCGAGTEQIACTSLLDGARRYLRMPATE